MAGAMRVYAEMIEKNDGRYSLPVGVSPEYKGDAQDAWGGNASFQLACIHYLCEHLMEAARVLKKEPDPSWAGIDKGLPGASIYESHDVKGKKHAQIGIWDGVPLQESRRHHSHLAAVHPFDTIDIDSREWRETVGNTLYNWIGQGMGNWSGWSLPWASMIHTRFGNADIAELLLEIWNRVFTNEGNGTLHDPLFPGLSTVGWGAAESPQNEIMQMDAGMGAAAAIMEMMVHTRRGVNYLFWGAPARWKNVTFERIRTEGGFEISGARRGNRIQKLVVKANAPGTIRIRNPWSSKVVLQRQNGSSAMQGDILEISLSADERVELTGE